MNSQTIKKPSISINNYIAAVVIGILVLGVLAASIIVNGNPFELHDKNLDQRRINDFMSLNSIINGYYNQKGNLPSNLNSLTVDDDNNVKKDPVTNVLYTYQITSDTSYNLCTTFATEQLVDENNIYPIYKDSLSLSTPASYPGIQTYTHKKGFDCISFKIYSSSPIPVEDQVKPL